MIMLCYYVSPLSKAIKKKKKSKKKKYVIIPCCISDNKYRVIYVFLTVLSTIKDRSCIQHVDSDLPFS